MNTTDSEYWRLRQRTIGLKVASLLTTLSQGSMFGLWHIFPTPKKETLYFMEPQINMDVLEEYTDDRDEQRRLRRITKNGFNLYKPVKSVPNIFLILLLGFYCQLGFLTQLIEDDMPRIIPNAAVPADSWDTFSEESALKYLHMIIGDQPRVSGTPYHLQKTKDLYALVNDIASGAKTPMVTDWQISSNDISDINGIPFDTYYRNVSNIIAVLEGESGFNSDGTTRTSLLVNCHYDSVPYAIGASDNGVFCAVLAEALKRLTRRTTKFKNNIIFLFNGAEENMLQGSHAFLYHKWARGVTAVINLDSAGMNGKPSVFQVTDPRVLSAYRSSVSRPSAQGVGEFLFSSGIIPSDTDFRIFRNYGNIQGIDIAFTKWGHVYHTRYDHPSLLKQGVIQNAGDTVLATIIAAADMDIEEKATPTAVVYVDFLNLFLVTLSQPVALAVDLVVALLALLSVAYYVWLAGPSWTTVCQLVKIMFCRLCSVLTGMMMTFMMTLIMVLISIQMRYLSQPWVVVPMFWLPYFVGAMAVSHCFYTECGDKSVLNRCVLAVQAMAATRLGLALALLLMALKPSLAPLRYMLAAPLLLMTLAACLSLTLHKYIRFQAWQHLIVEVLLSVPPVMFLCCLSLRILSMMLPIMARSSSTNPDVVVGLINLILAALMGVVVSGIELLFSRRRLWLPLGALLVGSVIVMLVPFSPYQDEGPSTQRHLWFHAEMIRHEFGGSEAGRQAGVLVTKLDPYSTSAALTALHAHGLQLNARLDFSEDCETKLLCGLPVHEIQNRGQSVMLYTGPPAPFSPAPAVTGNRTCHQDHCTFHFTVTVAPHNLVTVRPRAGVVIGVSPTTAHFQFQGRPVYAITYSVGTYSPQLDDLRLSFTVQANTTLQSGPLLDVTHHAHKIYNPEDFTSEYKTLLNCMPKYFNIATVTSFRNDYEF